METMAERAVTVNDFPSTWFAAQRAQFSVSGPVGLTYEQHAVPSLGSDAVVDCLLWRDDGALVGILYYYPNDVPPYERAGNVTVLVDPDRRREAIGIRLLAEADRRWLIDFDTQNYTSSGLELVTAYEGH